MSLFVLDSQCTKISLPVCVISCNSSQNFQASQGNPSTVQSSHKNFCYQQVPRTNQIPWFYIAVLEIYLQQRVAKIILGSIRDTKRLLIDCRQRSNLNGCILTIRLALNSYNTIFMSRAVENNYSGVRTSTERKERQLSLSCTNEMSKRLRLPDTKHS